MKVRPAAAEMSSRSLRACSGEMPDDPERQMRCDDAADQDDGQSKRLRERCQVRYSTSAIAQAAPSSDIVMML